MSLRSLATVVICFLVLLCPLLSLAQTSAATGQPDEKTEGFKNESELGAVVTGGNTRSESVNFKNTDAYVWSANQLKLNLHYLRNKAGDTESARNWSAALRFERALSQNLSAYISQGAEGDRYAGYDPRLNSDIGGKVFFTQSSDFTWSGEVGYRYTSERRVTSPDVFDHYGRLYTEVKKGISATSSGKFWIEYLPNFSTNERYQVNTEASVEAVMTSVFAIKLAYLMKYNNSPAAGVNERYDTYLTSSIVAKF